MRERDGPGPYPGRVTETTCERCGEILPERAKFCPNCGFPTATPPAEERKIVTVISADYREVSDELESLRGRAYNFAGDAVVGVFGIPTTHDDDALRAIRAG